MTVRRALALELQLSTSRWVLSLLLCALVLVVAALGTDSLATILPIWAALAWYRHGRGDTPERAELRASLGASRADRVHGRIALIAVESAVLALTGAIAPLLCSALGHEAVTSAGPTFAVSGRPGLSLLVTVGIGLAYQVAVLLITAIGVGGSAILHRPAHGHAVISVLVYLGAGLLLSLVWVLVAGTIVAGMDSPAFYGGLIAGFVVLWVPLGLIARRRARGWIDRLDAGATPTAAVA